MPLPLQTKATLLALLQKHLPAVEPAGCRLSTVSGLTGESWRITSPQHDLLARAQSQDKSDLGVERRREAAILRQIDAVALGLCALGPSVVLQAPDWLLVEWLEGSTVSAEQWRSDEGQLALARMLTRLHQLPLSGYRLNLRQQLARYWQHIDRRRLTPRWLRLHQKFMRRAPPVPLKLSLVHMDIHPENLVNTAQGIRLIDWEYAADADIALELAALFQGNNFSVAQRQQLLDDYILCGGYQDRQRLEQQIARWVPWVNYLMLMWCEVRWQQTQESRYIEWGQPLRQTLLRELPSSNFYKY